MPSLALGRIKALGRPHKNPRAHKEICVEHIEEVSTVRPGTSERAMERTVLTEEPPPYELPAYTEAAADCQAPVPNVPAPRRASSPVPSIAPSVYRQTHPPPLYRPRPRHSDAACSPHQHTGARARPKHTILYGLVVYKPGDAPAGPSKHFTPIEALCQAAQGGRSSDVQALLESGTDVYDIAPSGKVSSAVHAALRGPDPGLALLLLHYPCEQGRMFGSLVPPAGPEEANGRVQARLKFLLALMEKGGCTPLHLAASAGAAEVAREMLELGAAVNALDDLNRTPLHMAAKFARAETLDVLLEFGADPTLVREKLWDMAGPKAESELGDYAFVCRVVARAVDRRERGDGKDGLAEDEDTLRDFGWRGTGETDGYRNRGPKAQWDLDEDEEFARFTRSVRGVSLTNFTAAPLAVAGPSLEGGPLRPGPRLQYRTKTMRFDPRFQEWERICGTVKEEHQRQKQRNEASGSGAGGLA